MWRPSYERKRPSDTKKNMFFAHDVALLSRYGDLPRVEALFWQKNALSTISGALLGIYGAHPTSEGAPLSQKVPFSHMTASS